MLNQLPVECIENILNNMKNSNNLFHTSLGSIHTQEYLRRCSNLNNQITHINFIDILKLSLVSKYLYDVLKHDDIWYPLLIRDFRKGKYYKKKPKQIKNYYITKTFLPKTIKYYDIYKLDLEKHLYSRITHYQNRKSIETTIKYALFNDKSTFQFYPYTTTSNKNSNLITKSAIKSNCDDERIFYTRKINKSVLNITKLNCINSFKKYKHITNILNGIYQLIHLKNDNINKDKEYFMYLSSIKYIEDIKQNDKYQYLNNIISEK